MKIKRIIDSAASACNVRKEIAESLVREVFNQIHIALENGERVDIPEFGSFVQRHVERETGQPQQRVIRFKPATGTRRKDQAAQPEGVDSGVRAPSGEVTDES